MNKETEEKQILVKVDEQGKKMVVIPFIQFEGRRNIDWKSVEISLRQYVGSLIEMADSKDIVYIGNDFPDEFANSIYTKKLKGGIAKAKANITVGINKIVEIAVDKRWNPNYKEKHRKNAKNGWYRYNTQFALPQMNDSGKLTGFNIYSAVIIVRHASDNKLYLYDIINIKKETSKPL